MNTRFRIGAAVLTLGFSTAGTLAAQRTAPDTQKHPAPAAQLRTQAGDQEHTLPAARVPAPVREAFRRAYPNATVLKFGIEVENGRTIYEVESREGTTHRDVNLAADGTILETETQLAVAQLPAPVRTAAEANGARIQLAEVVVVGRDTTYEIKIQGRRGELKLRADGRPVPATPH